MERKEKGRQEKQKIFFATTALKAYAWFDHIRTFTHIWGWKCEIIFNNFKSKQKINFCTFKLTLWDPDFGTPYCVTIEGSEIPCENQCWHTRLGRQLMNSHTPLKSKVLFIRGIPLFAYLARSENQLVWCTVNAYLRDSPTSPVPISIQNEDKLVNIFFFRMNIIKWLAESSNHCDFLISRLVCLFVWFSRKLWHNWLYIFTVSFINTRVKPLWVLRKQSWGEVGDESLYLTQSSHFNYI